MELIDSVLGSISFVVMAFFGFAGLLVVAALLFGKRVEKKWDYEADFLDGRGREIGEFDIELSRVIEDAKAAVQPDFVLDVKFELKHPGLTLGQAVRVSLNGKVMFESVVDTEGRMRLGTADLVGEIKDPAVGQAVSVEVAGTELFSEPLRRD